MYKVKETFEYLVKLNITKFWDVKMYLKIEEKVIIL